MASGPLSLKSWACSVHTEQQQLCQTLKVWPCYPFNSSPGTGHSSLSLSPHRFCEVEFQGPLSIQEEWVRHLQRHILEMNFSKADPPPEEPQAPPSQTAAAEAP